MRPQLVLAFPSIFFLTQAAAAEWTAGGAATARTEWISNPGMAVPAQPARSRTSLGADVSLGARGELWDASASTGWSRWISGEENLEDTDANLSAQATRRFERSSAALAASFRRGSTQAGELTTTGILLTRVQSDAWMLSPSARHALTERLSINAGASYATTRYERSGGTTGLVDTSTGTLSAGGSYALAPATSAGATLSYGETDTEPFTTRSDTRSVQLSLSHAFSERWSASAAYGPSWTRTEAAAAVPICPVPLFFCQVGLVPFTLFPITVMRETRGNLYNLSSAYQLGAYTALSALASRSSSASGAGFVTDTGTISATLRQALGEGLAASLGAAQTRAESLGGLVADSRTRTRTLSATLSWQAAERWSVEAGASRVQVSLPAGLEPRSSTLFLALRYTPERLLIR